MNRSLKIFIGLAVILVVIGTLLAIRHKEELVLTPISVNGLNIQTWTASNGAKVLYVHAPQLPMVDLRITFDAGSARDAGQPGLARFTNNMLDTGAGEWDTNAITERFDSVGARYSNSTARDMATVSLRSLTDPPLLDKAIRTLAVVLTQPQFDPEELERLRKQTLISIKSQLQSPSSIASKAYYQADRKS
ncbi:MAG TPA: insulinase family protein, partial [Chromatiales bacterium]|nr:insulinase family protein [Chromatiales bacterium]